jgi:hypothetical protein
LEAQAFKLHAWRSPQYPTIFSLRPVDFSLKFVRWFLEELPVFTLQNIRYRRNNQSPAKMDNADTQERLASNPDVGLWKPKKTNESPTLHKAHIDENYQSNTEQQIKGSYPSNPTGKIAVQ